MKRIPFFTNAVTAMERRGVTAAQLGIRLGGLPKRTVRRRLNGATEITLVQAVQMAEALRVEPAALLFQEPLEFAASLPTRRVRAVA